MTKQIQELSAEQTSREAPPPATISPAEPDQKDIAALAYALWESRGCPDGSPEEDWFRALDDLRAHKTQSTTA
jgi:hypothetical protein